MMTLGPKQLMKALVVAIQARLPMLVTGAPGVGKSDIVAQASREAGMRLVLSHPVVADPTDAKGLPWVVDGRATWLPIGEVAELIGATEPTVWFLDDLGQAPAAVQASYMQWLLARQVNGHRLPECVSIVAATNRRQDRAGVQGILEPVKSRFASIVELQADPQAWAEWAIDHAMPAELVAFIRWRPELLSAFSATADMTNSPSPRGWSMVGRMIGAGMAEAVDAAAWLAIVGGTVGEGAAAEFIAFCRMIDQLPSIDQVLLDPEGVVLPASAAGSGAIYALVGALVRQATVARAASIMAFAGRLVREGMAEYGVLLVRELSRRGSAGFTSTGAWTAAMVGPVGQALRGE